MRTAPSVDRTAQRWLFDRTAGRRLQAVAAVVAVVLGFAVAAAVDAAAQPAVAFADDFGPGDGLTRWVLGTAGDPAAVVAAAAATPGVTNAQPLYDGGVLVATRSATPAGLADIPGVVSVERSVSVPVSANPTDPYWSSYGYNLENTGSNAYDQPAVADADLDATAGWAASTGQGQIVAVLDTGFDTDHADLAGALWTNPGEACGSVDTDGNGLAGDCHGWNYTTGTAAVDVAGENGSHGTAVAGVIAARKGNGLGSAGVAPEATIMPLVIGSGGTVDVNLGIQAIRYAVDHGASVINASWGGPMGGSVLAALQSAVAYAGSHGVLVVAAAGNDAGNRDTNPVYPASLTEDAVVTVGSSTASDTLSSSSGYGAVSVDLMAPGNKVFTTWNDGGYRVVSGTSFAAPEVAAALAQYRSLMPTATALEIKQALMADTDPVPAFALRSVSGGRLTTDGLASLGTQQVRWTYSGMTGAPGALSPSLTTSSNLPTGNYSAVLGLGMSVAGRVWAVSGQDVTIGGSTLTTDDSGTVTVPVGSRGPSSGALVLAPHASLTEGRYVLTVQLLQNGTTLGRPSVAPLLVGVSTPTTSSSGSSPTTTSASGPTSSSAGGTATGSAPGTSSPTGSSPGGASSSTSAGPTGSATSSSAGGAPSTTSASTTGAGPSTTASTSAAPTSATSTSVAPTSGAGPTSGSSGSSTSTSGASTTASGTTSSSASSSSAGSTSSSPVSTAPPSGSTVYPGVGDFLVTSMSPTQVDAAGGAAITVLGTFTGSPRVLVGSSGLATIVSSTSTRVVFTAPARVAGTYDVLISTTNGKQSLLSDALTYTSSTSTPTSSGGATPTTGSATPTTTSAPTSGSSTSSASTTSSSSTSGSAPSSAPPEVRTGPDGQRLVGTTFFGSIPASVWSTSCSSSCSGTLV